MTPKDFKAMVEEVAQACYEINLENGRNPLGRFKKGAVAENHGHGEEPYCVVTTTVESMEDSMEVEEDVCLETPIIRGGDEVEIQVIEDSSSSGIPSIGEVEMVLEEEAMEEVSTKSISEPEILDPICIEFEELILKDISNPDSYALVPCRMEELQGSFDPVYVSYFLPYTSSKILSHYKNFTYYRRCYRRIGPWSATDKPSVAD